MSIARAIRTHAPRFFQAQTTYQLNVVTVSTLMTSIYSSNLPVLNYVPGNWSEFVTTYQNASANAQDWATQVYVQLLNVPDDVASVNENISLTLADAASDAATLAKDGYNADTASALVSDLNLVKSQLALVTTYIQTCETAISSFQNNLPGLAGDLQTLTNDFASQVNADKNAIGVLNSDIQSLNNDIQNQWQTIVDASLALAGAIVIARVSPGWTPVGIGLKLLAAAVAAAASYGIDLAAGQISADKAQIANDQNQVTGYSEDVAACQLQASNYQNFANQVKSIGQTVTAILQEWQTLESEVGEAVNDVKAALNDANADNFSAVVTDVNDAQSAWQMVTAQANSLQLNLSVNTAVLEPGWTPEQAQQALAAGTNTDMVSFVNSQAVAFAS